MQMSASSGMRVVRPSRLWFVAAALGAFALFSGCGSEGGKQFVTDAGPSPLVRVRLGDDSAQALVTVHDRFQVYDLGSGRLIHKGDELSGGLFTARAGSLFLDGRPLGTGGAVVVPQTSGRIEVAGKDRQGRAVGVRYRGNLRVFAVGDAVSLVNSLDLEEYLPSVVGSELLDHWHIECLKAQAVAARSYALCQMKRSAASRPFDVYDTDRSQVYGGIAAETDKSRLAVADTRGVVLAYDDNGTERILEALYHSTCGGATVPVQYVWPNGKPVAPLSGVACSYCSDSPGYRWSLKTSAAALAEQMGRSVAGMSKLGKIVKADVLAQERTRDGRVQKVSIYSDDDLRWPVPGKAFKSCFPPTARFRSDRFDVSFDDGDVVVEGRGFGHGVGMCQYGAQKQALMGRKAEGILSFYYPGSRLVRVY